MKKKYKVVMLPTSDKASKIWFDNDSKKLLFDPIGVLNCTPQHLYFISEEEIKEGWVIDSDNELKYVSSSVINTNTGIARHIDDTPFILDGCKKIAATTDNGLFSEEDIIPYTSLPQIPQSFLKEYCNNPVEEVYLEQVELTYDNWLGYGGESLANKLKLTPNNEVIF